MEWKGVFLLPIVLLCVHAAGYGPKDRIHQRDIESLVFTRDGMTTGRRVSPRPQMKWTNPRNDIPPEDLPSTIHATNTGWDGSQVIWKFEAEMPDYLRLDQAQVQCEGYIGPGDPEVLVGSCGVVYSLKTVGPVPRKQNRQEEPFPRPPIGPQGPVGVQGPSGMDTPFDREHVRSEIRESFRAARETQERKTDALWSVFLAFGAALAFLVFLAALVSCATGPSPTRPRRVVRAPKPVDSEEEVVVDVADAPFGEDIDPPRVRRRVRVRPSAPVYVAPTVHHDRASSFVDGFVLGSVAAAPARPCTSTTTHHYHAPRRSPSPVRSSASSSFFSGGGGSNSGSSSSPNGGSSSSTWGGSSGGSKSSTSKTFGGTTSL